MLSVETLVSESDHAWHMLFPAEGLFVQAMVLTYVLDELLPHIRWSGESKDFT